MELQTATLTVVVEPVTSVERIRRNRHRGAVVWMTGLSGAGKSTLARAAERALFDSGFHVAVIDGDVSRSGLCVDLGFLPADRQENIRRVAEVARVFSDMAFVTIVATISPYARDRRRAREIILRGTSGVTFLEVYVAASITTCEARDCKGLYSRARIGAIERFTGITDPYEPPDDPDLTLNTEACSVEQCTQQLLSRVLPLVGVERE